MIGLSLIRTGLGAALYARRPEMLERNRVWTARENGHNNQCMIWYRMRYFILTLSSSFSLCFFLFFLFLLPLPSLSSLPPNFENSGSLSTFIWMVTTFLPLVSPPPTAHPGAHHFSNMSIPCFLLPSQKGSEGFSTTWAKSENSESCLLL